MNQCQEIIEELLCLWPVDKSELTGLPWFNIPDVRVVNNLFGSGVTNALTTRLASKDMVSAVVDFDKTAGTCYLADGAITAKITPKTSKIGDIYTIKLSWKTLGYGADIANFIAGLRKKGSSVAYVAYTSNGYYVFSPADDTRPQVKDEVTIAASSSCSVEIEFQNVQGALVVNS